MKHFLQLVIQEKCVGDYRAFLICIDEEGDRWELRGYGDTVGAAATDAYSRFEKPTDEWEYHGYAIPTDAIQQSSE